MRALVISTFLLFALFSAAQTDTVYSFVEQMPEFPGGDSAMVSFIGKNVVYPEYERVHNIEGKVMLRFVVDVTGSVRDIEVLKPLSLGLDREAVRVVKLLPKFTPGFQQGKAIKVYYNIPVRFKLAASEPKDSLLAKMGPDSLGIYTFVKKPPEFPGGDVALMKYLQQNIHYPRKARFKNIQGKVLVRCVINEDGSVSNAEIRKSVDPGLDAEALRVIKMLPNFFPCRMDGKPVKVYFNVPIVFRLTDNN